MHTGIAIDQSKGIIFTDTIFLEIIARRQEIDIQWACCLYI